jgi:molybdopterin converting factor small subunit
MEMDEKNRKIEVRGFLQLDTILRRKFGAPPLFLELGQAVSGRELAQRLDIPIDSIEVIFINGFVHALSDEIQPGDRIAFLPPGCPGPYRIALGFYSKNQDNEANFKLKQPKKV